MSKKTYFCYFLAFSSDRVITQLLTHTKSLLPLFLLFLRFRQSYFFFVSLLATRRSYFQKWPKSQDPKPQNGRVRVPNVISISQRFTLVIYIRQRRHSSTSIVYALLYVLGLYVKLQQIPTWYAEKLRHIIKLSP